GAFLSSVVVAIVIVLLLSAVHRSFEAEEWSVRVRKGVSVLLVSGGAFAAITNLSTAERTLVWEKPEPGQDLMSLVSAAKTKAKQEGKPLFLDFTAAWCAACKEIEAHTFPDERVQAAAARYVAVKMRSEERRVGKGV